MSNNLHYHINVLYMNLSGNKIASHKQVSSIISTNQLTLTLSGYTDWVTVHSTCILIYDQLNTLNVNFYGCLYVFSKDNFNTVSTYT